jgi:predicted nucleic acid-binding protein
VPSITLFEVFKGIRIQRDSEIALRAVSQVRRGKVVDLDADLAVDAADLSADLKLALADSIILATARALDATVWTQNVDFDGLDGLEYRAHQG